MEVLGLDWVGTRTPRFQETVDFFHKTIGLEIGFQKADFVRLDLPDSSCVEVFGPGDADHLHFTTGPAIGFLVEDIDVARHDLLRHRLELLGAVGGVAGSARWQHFRAPDGYVYEVVENPVRRPGTAPVGTLGVTRLAWMGTRAERYEETLSFFGSVLGLEVVEDLPELIEYHLRDGAAVEVFRPGSPLDHAHFTTGPVPGFGVRDLDHAVAELRSGGVPLLQTKRSAMGGWAHFRAPDGYVYEVKQ
jgi:catechol 2,3-dioxygenase-like lactoylglutathione lyase family enzyme